MTQAVPARSVGSTIAGALAIPSSGAVAAVFSRSCYLDLNGRIFALVAPELLRGPLNVVVAPPERFAFEQLPAGAAVRLRPPTLTIAGGPTVDLAQAERWDAGLPPLVPAAGARLRQGMERIKEVLAGAPVESLAHPAFRPARAAEGMDALHSGLRARNSAAVAAGVQCLAGLGLGLTPSGDDLLTGALVAIALLRPPHAASVRGAVLEGTRGRTTRISRAYLEAAARGEAGEAWHLLALRLDEGPDEEITTAAARVLAFGETSGADLLVGFLLGLEALSER